VNKILIAGGFLLFIPALVSASTHPTGTYVSKNFRIDNMSAVYTSSLLRDHFDLIGILYNIGNNTYSNVSLEAQLFDQKSKLIDVESGSPVFSTFFPGGISGYKIPVKVNASDFHHYVIQVGGSNRTIQ
jgi:hypothetical protein